MSVDLVDLFVGGSMAVRISVTQQHAAVGNACVQCGSLVMAVHPECVCSLCTRVVCVQSMCGPLAMAVHLECVCS